jgi:hypothetical protein
VIHAVVAVDEVELDGRCERVPFAKLEAPSCTNAEEGAGSLGGELEARSGEEVQPAPGVSTARSTPTPSRESPSTTTSPMALSANSSESSRLYSTPRVK